MTLNEHLLHLHDDQPHVLVEPFQLCHGDDSVLCL